MGNNVKQNKRIIGLKTSSRCSVVFLLFFSACSFLGQGADTNGSKTKMSSTISEEDISINESSAESGELAEGDSRARLGDKTQKSNHRVKPGKKTTGKLDKKQTSGNTQQDGGALSTEVTAILPEAPVNWDPSRGEIPDSVVTQEGGNDNLPRRYKPVNYPYGPLRTNPSLWPDESQSSSLFRDFRAFQPMDIVTIIINENSEGKKKADTDTKTDTSVLAGIAKFFGIETSKWESNNLGLDPSKLIDASTQTSFKGEGETNRSGKMTGQISARIVEVLANGLLRVEGRKSLTLNEEEEVIVIKGLVRPNDVSALNQVQSNRIANLEIAFYGKGVLGNEQSPGWLYGWFRKFWPF